MMGVVELVIATTVFVPGSGAYASIVNFAFDRREECYQAASKVQYVTIKHDKETRVMLTITCTDSGGAEFYMRKYEGGGEK